MEPITDRNFMDQYNQEGQANSQTKSEQPPISRTSRQDFTSSGHEWWERKQTPWELYPPRDNPSVIVHKGVEFRWWVDQCVESDPASVSDDVCPGYVVEHQGPGGEWNNYRECPLHGFRWSRELIDPIEKSRLLEARKKAANIPAAYQNYSLYNFPEKDAPHYNACLEYALVNRLTSSLMLQGPFGTGKTSLAVSILKQRIQGHNEHGLFMVVPTLFAEIRAGFNQPNPPALLERVKSIPGLLVLDDLGAERATEWVQEQLYDILNTRMLNGRPTLVTTNLRLSDLVDRIGERTMERVKSYRVIVVGGDNLRNRMAD